VNRQLLVIVCIGIVLLAGVVVTVIVMRPPPQPPRAIAKVERTIPQPVVTETRRAPVPAREAASARRASTPDVESTPPPAAVPPPAEPAPDVGILHIDSDVPGAQVFIDRQYIGATPLAAARVTPGTHRLNVSAQGYEGVAETIEVAEGPRDVLIKLKEVRLDSKIDVVHKHRLGSCRGQLVATPQGLRYETTDRDDAFSAALLDLEGFQVDYLQKNLKVKLRKGKGYDFTDPEGNADRLFVFFRDVEKARERLRKGDPPASE
jgi:hypothetical protein